MSWTEPENLAGSFRDAQWQKYLFNLWPVENAAHRGYYAAYLTRQWNGSHAPAQHVKTLDLVYMQQETLAGISQNESKESRAVEREILNAVFSQLPNSRDYKVLPSHALNFPF